MLPIVEWSICCSYFLCFVLTKFRPLLSPRMKHNLLKAGDRHVLLLTWWCGLTDWLFTRLLERCRFSTGNSVSVCLYASIPHVWECVWRVCAMYVCGKLYCTLHTDDHKPVSVLIHNNGPRSSRCINVAHLLFHSGVKGFCFIVESWTHWLIPTFVHVSLIWS